MFCSKCGKKIENTYIFCPNCGAENKSVSNGDQPSKEQTTNLVANNSSQEKWQQIQNKSKTIRNKNLVSSNLWLIVAVICGIVTLVSFIIIVFCMSYLKAMGF